MRWILVLVFLSAPILAMGQRNEEAIRATEKINEVRQMAGMTPFGYHELLAKAAKSHAKYLIEFPGDFHGEVRQKPGFTGENPSERANHFGYPSKLAGENLSIGQKYLDHSIEGLMSAIYHRFGFLNFHFDTMGFGMTYQDPRNYVYVMGNQSLAQLCKKGGKKQGRYILACKGDKPLSQAAYEKAMRDQALKNPEAVLWPPAGSQVVPPVFYEEVPDPMPDRLMTGYPASVQINPELFSEPELISFRIFDSITQEELTDTRILTEKNDINKKFSAHQFALFPMERLKWDHPYRVEAKIKTKEKDFDLTWRFRTNAAPGLLAQVEGRGEWVEVAQGKTYSIHVPPADHRSFIENLSHQSALNTQFDFDWVDKNTIRFKSTGKPCDKVAFSFGSSGQKRGFNLLVRRDQDNLNRDHRYPTEEPECIAPRMKGHYYVIPRDGQKQVLSRSKDYYFRVPPKEGSVQMRYTSGLNVSMEMEGVDLLKIKGVGKPGEAQITLPGGLLLELTFR